ncbi:DUF3906 family protein [Peribacillus butanolivorans]|nr:DUF3906 family protein [Peribacillus butanolivorans]AXN36974.1 DUF3906 family protein [Peribacillus butanolivorans]
MNLYRFEVTIKEELIHVIIAADSDEKAFQLVDIELEKRFLKMPEVDDISLYEKRKINNGTGYVLSEF